VVACVTNFTLLLTPSTSYHSLPKENIVIAIPP